MGLSLLVLSQNRELILSVTLMLELRLMLEFRLLSQLLIRRLILLPLPSSSSPFSPCQPKKIKMEKINFLRLFWDDHHHLLCFVYSEK
jgi:hypothetical protein